MEWIFTALQWLGGVLKGLFEVTNTLNMFNKTNTNYNVGNGGILNQIVLTNPETAAAFANAMTQHRPEVEQSKPVPENPDSHELHS